MNTMCFILRSARQRTATVRMLAFSVVMFLACWFYNEPVRTCAVQMQYPCSPWVFPFMMSQYTFLLLFFLAAIYANADIPFMQYSNLYVLLRAGRKKWGAVQVCVLFLRALAVTAVTALCSAVTLLPAVEATADWGKLLRTLALGMLPDGFYLEYSILYEAIVKWSPAEAFVLTFLITALVVFFLYSAMFLVSLYTGRGSAVYGAAFFIFSMFLILNTHPKIRHGLAKLVPVLWPEIARLYTPDYGYYWLPSPVYMLVFLSVGSAVMAAVIIRRIGYIEFEWIREEGKGGIL